LVDSSVPVSYNGWIVYSVGLSYVSKLVPARMIVLCLVFGT
jgi:hypothetical protein